MMKKVFLSMLLLMLCVTYAVANPITQAQALEKAKAFLQKKGTATTTNLNLVYQGRQGSPQHGAPVKDPCFYVFNNGQNAGFVIVAGDDCADEVLGYADSGTFAPNDIPSNMEEFLKGYVEEIENARARNLRANSSSPDVEMARKVVAPLIQTHWDQHDPYNQQCPIIGGERCVTGCVATAFAQVMYYYKWPQGETKEEVEAYSFTNDGITYNYDALPITTFKWDKMKPVYINTGEDDEDAEAAVAELMHYCGQAVKMEYGVNESGAQQNYIPNALIKYFDYPNDPQSVSRSSYTTEEWDELIYTELKFGRPVLYAANTSGGSGHEFICDGYDGHGLYHINWGWGGLSDGYFRLQALRPSNQGTGGSGDYGGYSLNQEAVIGVSATKIVSTNIEEEEEVPEIKSGLETDELKVISDLTIDYNSDNGFYNVQASFTFALAREETCVDYGFAIYQDGQLIQQMVSREGVTLEQSYAYSTSGQLIWNLGTNLADGTYQIVGISRVNGTEEWYPNVDSDRNYIEVVISNGQATFTNVKIVPPVPVRKIDITNVEQRFDLGEKFTQIRAYVTNIGDTDYSKQLRLSINRTTKGVEGVYIPVGGEDYVDFFFPAMTGTVRLELSTYYGSVYLNEDFILSEYTAPEQPELTVEGDVNIKNLGDGKMYGAMLDGAVKLRNENSKDFEGNLRLKVKVLTEIDAEGGWWSIPYNVSIPVSIKANETKNIPITYTGLTIGDQFRYTLYGPDETVLGASGWFIKVVPGITLWKGNGERTAVEPTTNFTIPEDVCAVSFEDLGDNLSNYNFVLNNNPNTIYYVTGSATGFDNPTIVRGGIAGDIELVTEKDFFIPKHFRAKSIVYSWTPYLGADGKNGWQTITLPFGVQSVTSAAKPDREIDWYHGIKNEGEKDFWVREFKQVEGNVVKFADAIEWVANVPYIIAVPGDHWGAQYDLTKQIMQFKANNVLVERTAVSAVVSDGYEFVGLTGGMNPLNEAEELALSEKFGDVYILNNSGNAFVPASIDQVTGKHNLAYFTINDRTITPPAYLNIGTFDTIDGISIPQMIITDGQQVDVYAIDGVKVSTVTINNGIIDLSRLPKGVYIVEGRKVVRK